MGFPRCLWVIQAATFNPLSDIKKGNFIGVSSKIRIALIQDPEQFQEDSQNNSIKERKHLLMRFPPVKMTKLGCLLDASICNSWNADKMQIKINAKYKLSQYIGVIYAYT